MEHFSNLHIIKPNGSTKCDILIINEKVPQSILDEFRAVVNQLNEELEPNARLQIREHVHGKHTEVFIPKRANVSVADNL